MRKKGLYKCLGSAIGLECAEATFRCTHSKPHEKGCDVYRCYPKRVLFNSPPYQGRWIERSEFSPCECFGLNTAEKIAGLYLLQIVDIY